MATIENSAPVAIEVRNITISGLKCLCAAKPSVGQAVKVQIGRTVVQGRVARVIDGGFAMTFMHYVDVRVLELMRGAGMATNVVGPAPPAQVDEDELRDAIRKIL